MGQWSDLAEQEAAKITGGGPWEFAKDLGRNARGVGEAAMTIGSSIAADIPAGWAGLMAAGDDRINAADAVEKTQNALTYQPRSAEGQRALAGIGNAMQSIMEPFTRGADAVTQYGADAGLPPWATAIPLTALTAGSELIPGKKGASGTARAATRINLANKPGRYAAMAEEAAGAIDADLLRVAEKYDPNIARAAGDVQAGQPMRPADPSLVDRSPQSNMTSDAERQAMMDAEVGSGRRINDTAANDLQGRTPDEIYGELEAEYDDLVQNRSDGRGSDYEMERANTLRNRMEELEPKLGQTGIGKGQRGSVENTGAGKQVLKTQAGRNVVTNAINESRLDGDAVMLTDKVDDALAKEFPDAGPRNKILQMTRQAISEGGIAKVRELVKQGVLPAIVITILADEEQTDPASNQRPRA
jgi:hypothetical protein